MKKVLLLDTNISSSPIYEFLLRQGFEVFVIGSNPLDFLAKHCSNYINLDYSKIDQVQNLIDNLNIDFIVPGCNDLSYLVCVTLNKNKNYFGLESYEVNETINNKEKFRLFATDVGLSIPKLYSKQEDVFNSPVIIKPVDAFSGRGITVLKNPDKKSLDSAMLLAESFSKNKQCIIEEYVEGNLFSHSAFISKGEIQLDFIVEEFGTVNEFAVDSSRVVYDFPEGLRNNIRDEIRLMINKLNLIDGLIHTQFIKKENSFWIIEITKRCPGDLYSQLIELSTGFKYAEAYTKPFINLNIDKLPKPSERKHILRHTISQPKLGIFTSLRFQLPIRIEKFIQLCVSGDQVKESPFGRIGLLFLNADSAEESNTVFDAMLKRQLYLIN